jgi:dTDP-4-amino-4,6-dideoxygalactose transaminase
MKMQSRKEAVVQPQTTPSPAAFDSFRIGFDPRDKAKVFDYWNEIFTTQKWTEGKFTSLFEEKWAKWNGVQAVATGTWGGAAIACMDYFKLAGKKVLCPSNTFAATPMTTMKAGAEVVFADCSRKDLSLSYEDVVTAAEKHQLAAVWLVHIGGHIAFDTPRIAEFCRSKGIVLLEDCAHAHGASWDGKRPGTWGDAGVYSFYPTKTVSTGEGGMLVSRHKGLIDFAMRYRNWGKPEYEVIGLNYRLSEFTAALGVVQVDRMEEIVAWKNEIAQKHLDSRFPNRVRFPSGMVSGLYKYIVFDPIEKSTGKVYDTPCHAIFKRSGSYPNTEWVAKNHWCVPLYYTPKV